MDLDKVQSVITDYKSDGNLRIETQQVHPTKNLISTNMMEESDRVVILNKEMIEVEKLNDLTNANEFYVDYNNGRIYFHSSLKEQSIQYRYRDAGNICLSANNVFTKVDDLGNVIEYLSGFIDRVEDKLVEFKGKIDTYKEMLDNVEDAEILINQLHEDVIEANIIEPILSQTNKNANATKIELDKSLIAAQEDIATIKATGNTEILILASEWTLNNGIYEKQITHDLNSDNAHVSARNSDTKESVTIGYKIIDKSKILLKSDEAINMSVVLNASYYKPMVFTNVDEGEIVRARKGETSLDIKIGKIDTAISETNSSLETNKNLITNNMGLLIESDMNLQDVINAAINSNVKSIYLESGKTYTLTSSLSCRGNIEIIGNDTTLIRDFTGTTGNLIIGGNGLKLKGINLIGLNATNQMGIRIDGFGDVCVEDCILDGFFDGVYMKNTSNNKFKNVKTINNVRDGITIVEDVKNIEFENCEIGENSTWDIEPLTGEVSNITMRNMIVKGRLIAFGSAAFGIKSSGLIFENVEFTDTSLFKGNMHNIRFKNCKYPNDFKFGQSTGYSWGNIEFENSINKHFYNLIKNSKCENISSNVPTDWIGFSNGSSNTLTKDKEKIIFKCDGNIINIRQDEIPCAKGDIFTAKILASEFVGETVKATMQIYLMDSSSNAIETYQCQLNPYGLYTVNDIVPFTLNITIPENVVKMRFRVGFTTTVNNPSSITVGNIMLIKGLGSYSNVINI